MAVTGGSKLSKRLDELEAVKIEGRHPEYFELSEKSYWFVQ